MKDSESSRENAFINNVKYKSQDPNFFYHENEVLYLAYKTNIVP